MRGLLGLLWLSPKDPNLLDRVFGGFTDRKQVLDNQFEIAWFMLVVMLVALVWSALRKRPELLRLVGLDPKDKKAGDKKVDDKKTASWVQRGITGVLLFVALLSSVNYFYGTRNNGVYVHRWDAFHTVIGVKYHSELGYFDLYKCAYAIDREGPHHFRAAEKIRDLRTRKFVPREVHIAGNDCKERFTPERLEEFRHDLDQFGTWSNKRQWKGLFKDKGFNGTPFYATVCKLLISTIDVDLDSLKKLAVIDPILMLFAFCVVGWAFGARKAAIVAIFFCVFFPNRFTHMGGSILRFDYVATLMIGFSALKKDKWGVAGAMFAWATMVRVFPAIFAVGVGLKILSDVVQTREIRDEHWKFVGWYAGVLALCFVISLIGMDGGFENWQTWYENMKIHNRLSASYRVGFKHLFMLDGKLTSSNYGLKQSNFEARQGYYWLAVAVLFGPLLLAVRRLDTISFAALFGVFGFFLLAVATRYYWGVAAILFLVDRKLLSNRFMIMMGAMLFFATAFDFFFWELYKTEVETKPFSLMYNLIVGVELTAVIAAISSWLLVNPSLLDVGDDPRLPTHVPAKLGAVAAPVDLSLGTKTKKKKKKKTKAATADADADADADDADADDSGEPEPKPRHDSQAVTVSDVGVIGTKADPPADKVSVEIPKLGMLASGGVPADTGSGAGQRESSPATEPGDADTDEHDPES